MDRALEDEADEIRHRIERGEQDPAAFRAAILRIPHIERDAWLDRVLDLGELPEDDPALPSGCVPYLPCGVDALLRAVAQIPIRPSDVVVDVGAGVGRAAAFLHLATGASVIGIEIQPRLVLASRALAVRLRLTRMSILEGDAPDLVAHLTTGSIFFLYCPFSGERLTKVLDALESIARNKTLRVCSVDLPIAPCDWLVPEPPIARDLVIYRSTGLAAPSSAPRSADRSSVALHGLLKK